jgi:hypothetical protein
MIGYTAELDIDHHFLARVTQDTIDWRNEAGIHPDADIGGVSGSTLAAVGLLLVSSYLKHIRFVDVGARKVPEANYPMSLTIWKARSELTECLSQFTGMAVQDISAALNLFTVNRNDVNYFQTERTPVIPMLIEVSGGYLLSPVSSIFRNPFQGLRMLHEQRSSRTEASLRKPRENWMISDLCHLFLGNRYTIVDKPTRLKRGGQTVTDVDAAVLDRTIGALALFQLKWQDFNVYEIKKQRSKAKNFVDGVSMWAQKVKGWTSEFGTDGLCRSLQLKRGTYGHISSVRLFAIGRFASRFQGYGYVSQCKDVAVSAWAQFVRLRFEIGPVEDVFQSLHAKLQAETVQPVSKIALPHEISAAGQRVMFEDFWNVYGDEGEE